jgi:hypothetical protein
MLMEYKNTLFTNFYGAETYETRDFVRVGKGILFSLAKT